MNVKEHIEYWLKSAAHDMDVADIRFQSLKFKFYQICTRKFTEEQFSQIKDL
ncbi:MAG: hypothetical protein QY317_00945 [Candidatus Jettenia caeni]|nr:MAG: hypothetical protein QY317_00945 [Candidatus Jettenia caeni]